MSNPLTLLVHYIGLIALIVIGMPFLFILITGIVILTVFVSIVVGLYLLFDNTRMYINELRNSYRKC